MPDSNGQLNGVAEREYRCMRCGRLLFRARGAFADTEISTVCPYRSCKRMNILRLNAVQEVTDRRRQSWVKFNTGGPLVPLG